MDENTALTIYIVIAIASLIGILITINLIIYYCCVKYDEFVKIATITK